MFAGHVITGGTLSSTVTKKVHWLKFLAWSVAVQVTSVAPTGKLDPDGGVHTTLTEEEQLSDAVGAG